LAAVGEGERVFLTDDEMNGLGLIGVIGGNPVVARAAVEQVGVAGGEGDQVVVAAAAEDEFGDGRCR
jgi:hypothetical protein